MAKKKKSEALKASEILAAMRSVTKEKSVSMDLVLDTLRDALSTGARKLLGRPAHIEVEVDQESGELQVYSKQVVVEEVTDPENEIQIDEAREIDPEIEIGDELVEDLDIADFGRIPIQTAKQVIIQRVRDAERNKIFDDYSERIGELITGTVQQIDRGNVLINLGRTEALLPYREQIRKERYRQGDNIRACIAEVKNNPKGPQIIASRTCPEFLARLFELEVPEIYDSTVRIVKVVRDPGHRSKIAVSTSDSRVDPVGACVGMRGNRVQAIVRELSNERIDIINWTDEFSLLVRRVFSPAEVKRVIPVTENKIVVIIAEEDLAQAIGREGQNIRLASRMVEKEIDVYGDEEFTAMTDEEREAALTEAPAEEPQAVEEQATGLTAGTETEAAAEEAATAELVEGGAAEEVEEADTEATEEEAAVGNSEEEAEPATEDTGEEKPAAEETVAEKSDEEAAAEQEETAETTEKETGQDEQDEQDEQETIKQQNPES